MIKKYNAMNKSKELPGEIIPTVEEPKPKESSPAAPVIETPDPPQVIDPSASPAVEREKPSRPAGKRKRNNLTHFVKLDY